MNKKIIIGCIFAIFIMLSMPMITNITAKETKTDTNDENYGEWPCKPYVNLMNFIDGIQFVPLKTAVGLLLIPYAAFLINIGILKGVDIPNDCNLCA